MQNTHYLPSDIHNKALRNAYYTVQNIIVSRYTKALNSADDRNAKRELKERFNADLRDTINYYVNLL